MLLSAANVAITEEVRGAGHHLPHVDIAGRLRRRAGGLIIATSKKLLSQGCPKRNPHIILFVDNDPLAYACRSTPDELAVCLARSDRFYVGAIRVGYFSRFSVAGN